MLKQMVEELRSKALWRGVEPRSPAIRPLTGGCTIRYTTRDVKKYASLIDKRHFVFQVILRLRKLIALISCMSRSLYICHSSGDIGPLLEEQQLIANNNNYSYEIPSTVGDLGSKWLSTEQLFRESFKIKCEELSA